MKPFLSDYFAEIVKEVEEDWKNNLVTSTQVTERLANIGSESVSRMKEAYAKRKIIEVTLENTTAYLTGDLERTCNIVQKFGYTPKDVEDVYVKTKERFKY